MRNEKHDRKQGLFEMKKKRRKRRGTVVNRNKRRIRRKLRKR